MITTIALLMTLSFGYVELHIEVSNVCDLKCAMCPTFSALHTKRLSNVSQVERGLVDIDTVTVVNVGVAGARILRRDPTVGVLAECLLRPVETGPDAEYLQQVLLALPVSEVAARTARRIGAKDR